MRIPKLLIAVGGAYVCLMPGAGANASTIGASMGVEFGIGGSQGITAGISPTAVAGVVPTANWNIANGNSGTLANITADTNGTATPTSVSVTWTTSDTWNNTANNGFTGADSTLNTAYLDGGSGQATNLSITNLPGAAYNIYITSVDQGEATKGGNIGVNGTYDSVLTGNVAGPNYIQSTGSVVGNYHLFASVAPVAGTITISTDASNNTRTPIDSLELVPVTTPEPASVAVLAFAAMGLLARRRRLK